MAQQYFLNEGEAEVYILVEEEVKTEEEQEFTKVMAARTKNAHGMIDLLLSEKIGIVMSDDRVWADGLSIFCEIFRFLEGAMERLRPKMKIVNRFYKVLSGIQRTKAFEDDLNYYYGNGTFRILYYVRQRLAVGNFLCHLRDLEYKEPILLIPYIYHLYMGLLSGCQILERRRELHREIIAVGRTRTLGNQDKKRNHHQKRIDAVTQIQDSIANLKKEIKFTMDDIACALSKDELESLLDESILVFQYITETVNTIKTDENQKRSTESHSIFEILLCALGSTCCIILVVILALIAVLFSPFYFIITKVNRKAQKVNII